MHKHITILLLEEMSNGFSIIIVVLAAFPSSSFA
jgi:hypothetical protein